MKARKIHVVGIGPGDKEYILPAGMKAIEASDALIGGKRNLEMFSHVVAEKVTVGNNLEEICRYIQENSGSKAIAVLASGDPGIFSITEYLKGRLLDIDLEVIPGISSFQYLCAKLKESWQDIRITSLHGREEENLIEIIKQNRKVAVFVGGTSLPEMVCKDLMQAGLEHVLVTVGENLSYPDERIVTGSPSRISEMCFESLSIMLVCNERAEEEPKSSTNGIKAMEKALWQCTTSGIPDELFIRGEVPMTKEEIRAVTLSKLRLGEKDTVYDIGAGTGSVSIECGIRCPGGTVYAVEKEADAVDLIKRNIEKFKLENIQVVEGNAPEILKDLPAPDKVFIGGSSGQMGELLEWVRSFKKPARVVVNAVAVESVYEAIQGFEQKGYTDIDIVSLSVSRGRLAGGKHLMQALNPIYIISAELRSE